MKVASVQLSSIYLIEKIVNVGSLLKDVKIFSLQSKNKKQKTDK